METEDGASLIQGVGNCNPQAKGSCNRNQFKQTGQGASASFLVSAASNREPFFSDAKAASLMDYDVALS
jgi:hypothetical protein